MSAGESALINFCDRDHTMKINEIEAILREKTTLSEERLQVKAVLILLGKFKLNNVINEFCKEDTEMIKQKVRVNRDWFYSLGMSEVTITRKVINIVVDKSRCTYTGIAKIGGKRVEVSKTTFREEWTINHILEG